MRHSTDLQRINSLHNDVKHFDEKFAEKSRRALPKEMREIMSFKLFAIRPDDSAKFDYKEYDISNTPFWLTNDGLESNDASVTFTELADEILNFYKQAEDLATMGISVAGKQHESPQSSR
jgi:hypothetical protein